MSFRTEPEAATHSGQTDFGREMRGAGTLSLAEALRDRAWRTARAEAYRFQVAMGLVGFVGGMIVVVPAVLWLASLHNGGAIAQRTPPAFAEAVSASASHPPALLSAPIVAEPEKPATPADVAARPVPGPAPKAPTPKQLQAIEEARSLIRFGQVQSARAVLIGPGLAELGEAAFVLAETYDPNVLAALGVTAVQADAQTARFHYEAALAKGIGAAASRLDALE
jgi:hypothetical protein